MKSIDDEEANKRRDALQNKLAAIYKGSPRTNDKAYAAAQRALKDDQEFRVSQMRRLISSCRSPFGNKA